MFLLPFVCNAFYYLLEKKVESHSSFLLRLQRLARETTKNNNKLSNYTVEIDNAPASYHYAVVTKDRS